MVIKKIIMMMVMVVISMSAVKFNTSNVSDNEFDLYQISDFNGVDYTTTPTKVDDSRAIEMSNYIPEGRTLVKRKGYSPLRVDSTLNPAYSYMFSTWLDDGEDFEVKDDYVEMRYVEYKNHLLFFMGRSSNGNDSKKAISIFALSKYNDILTVKDTLLFESWDNNDWDEDIKYRTYKYRCKDGVITSAGGSLWCFVFGSYFKIDIEGSGSTYTYSCHDVILEDLAYEPTLALNVQPINSSSKVVNYEQLNMLNKKFFLELYVPIELEFNNETGDGNNTTINIDSSYSLGELLDNVNAKVVEAPIVVWLRDLSIIKEEITETGIYPDKEISYNIRFEFTPKKDAIAKGITLDVDTEWTSLGLPIYTPFTLNGTGKYYAKVKVEFEIQDYNIADFLTAKKGCVYGAYNSNDRLFVGNTKNSPNVDFHTLDDKTGKPNYTYFGTETYNAIGESGSEIVAYQLLNDGSMAILKDNKDITNIFVRKARIEVSKETYYVYDYINDANVPYEYVKSVELYPTISTGLYVPTITADTKIVLYDNKLIFNTKDGVYYLSLNSDTSNQTYSAKDISYYIKNDISGYIGDSTLATDDKYLYVARENKDASLRIYVADKNRYSFVNGELQYEWWALDNIPAYDFITLNSELLFVDDYYTLYSFKDNQYYDVIEYKTNSAKFGEQLIDTEIAFDPSYEGMIVSPTSETFTKLLGMWWFNSYLSRDDVKGRLKFIKDYVKVRFSNSVYTNLYDNGLNPIITSDDDKKVLTITLSADDEIKRDYITTILNKNLPILINEENSNVYKKYKLNTSITNPTSIDYINNDTITYTINLIEDGITTYALGSAEQSQLVLVDIANEELDIRTMVSSKDNESDINVLDYQYIGGKGWCDEYGNLVATGLPNLIDFTLYGVPVNFYDEMSTINTYETTFVVRTPIFSVWCSKFTNFNRIDVLKSTRSIHFTPETRHGGYTKIGYRTMRKTGDLVNEDYKALLREVYYTTSYSSNNFNFENIDFNNMDFSSGTFARSYSAPKKIKHFEYLQIKMFNDNFYDSSISQLVIKYMYSRNNKGVR